MNRQDELFDTLAFGLVAVVCLFGGPLAVSWAVNGRSAAGYAFFALFALLCVAAMVAVWRGR